MPRLQLTFRMILFAALMAALISGSLSLAAQESIPLAAGDTVSGTLSGDVNSFNYDLLSSDTPLLLAATSDEFTPTLGLAHSSGTGGGMSFSFDGDVGNPLFIPPLVQGQSAQLQVSSNRFPAAGAFTLTAVAVTPTPITAGSSVEGSVGADGAPQYFSFEAQLGQLITVTANGGSFDTRLQLFAPGLIRSVATDNDGGVGYDPEIYQAVLSSAGTGYIEVAPAFAGDSGSFTLSLVASDPPMLDENMPVIIRLGASRGTGALLLSGMAGAKAEMAVRGVGGDPEDATIAVYQDGVRLIWDNRFDPDGSGIYQFDMRTTSPVYIIITADTRFGEAVEGQFEVSFRRL